MDAVNYSTFRDNMKEYCDKICETQETYIVTRKADQGNVVILSIDTYNELLKKQKEEKKPRFVHKTFEERLAECDGKTSTTHFDWGEPKGRELL